MLKDKIQEDLKAAMMAKDAAKLSAIRMLKSAIQYYEIAKGLPAGRQGGAGYEAIDDDVVDVIQSLPENLQDKMISAMDENQKKEVHKLSSYEHDTVGGLMTTDFISVSIDWNIAQTIEYFRKVSPEFRSVLYIYVIDNDGILQGSISARGLICAD